MAEQEKSFFDRLGDILNAPLHGTEAKVAAKTEVAEDASSDDTSILERVKDILNTPLPSAASTQEPEVSTQATETVVETEVVAEVAAPEITEDDVPEGWWEADWNAFKEHQAQDQVGLSQKQRMDQEAFARYQEQERAQFSAYQLQELGVFQTQQQAKINWAQAQQVAQEAGQTAPFGMVPPAPPAPPLPPTMPTPPWVKS